MSKENSKKVYEFNDKHYCEYDISEIDDKYAGDLDDLWDAMCESSYYHKSTFYCTDEDVYESKRELIDDHCEYAYWVE